jgi:5-methylcytosine-specific restriction enzyme subunit McrC
VNVPIPLKYLRESSKPQRLDLPELVATELARQAIATVAPLGNGEWLVSAISKVGVVEIGGIRLHIEPKVPIKQLFFLLSRTFDWDAWRDESVELSSLDDLFPAVGALFARAAEGVLQQGALRKYREQRVAEPAVRGRWLVSEQIQRRHGLHIPAELSVDEFTIDIDENRILRSAARRLIMLAGLNPSVLNRLHRIESELSEARLLTRGLPIPNLTFDRTNRRYGVALGLARLILENKSVDDGGVAEVSASGFLLDMPRLFERFIEVEVRRATHHYGGSVLSQKRDFLDQDAQVVVKPDLVWSLDGEVLAVFDAKYKAEKPAGYPNADIYQMLAYCIRHEVVEGHLIYAAGNELPKDIVIEHAGITVVCHAVNLSVSSTLILEQIEAIVARAARGTRSFARSSSATNYSN